jgi:hypothetical protein
LLTNFIPDFLILSIHDLQLGDSDANRVDKKEVAAYVFLNDKCLDCLVLGSQSAQMQDPQQSSSGGAATSNRAKKVRVSLFDTKKRLQLIVKKVGKDPVQSVNDILIDSRQQSKHPSSKFGSVTFSLKKLA